jgi:hypothetical protein
MINLSSIVSELKAHREALQKEIHKTDSAIRALAGSTPASNSSRPKLHSRKMSAASRAKIAARMKKFWADKKKKAKAKAD